MTMQKALEILGGDTPLAAERWAERELCGGENDEEPEEDFESDEIAFRAITANATRGLSHLCDMGNCRVVRSATLAA